jgi:hypothetical protein
MASYRAQNRGNLVAQIAHDPSGAARIICELEAKVAARSVDVADDERRAEIEAATSVRLVGFAHYPIDAPRNARPLILVRFYRCDGKVMPVRSPERGT